MADLPAEELAAPARRAARAVAGWTAAHLRGLRRLAVTAYVVVLAVYCVRQGVPTDRLLQAVWIVAGMTLAMIGRPWRAIGRLYLDWTPFIGLLLAYDFTRGVADTLGFPIHVAGPVHADEAMFAPLLHGGLPTVWLQDHLYDPATVHWWDVVVALVYFSHFVLPWALAGVLYVRSRALWASYAVEIITLSAAGLATYVLYPGAPPWYASQVGLAPAGIDRIATRGWSVIGLHDAGVLLTNLQAQGNPVAAMPSLHAATTLLVTAVLWRLTRRRWVKALLALYPPTMAFALVYGGEHYVIDVLVGWGYVVVILAVLTAIRRARARRRSGAPYAGQPARAA